MERRYHRMKNVKSFSIFSKIEKVQIWACIIILFLGIFVFAKGAKAVCLATIGADRKYAGAISSLVCNGKEFIDNFDHGRQLQTALTYGGNGALDSIGCDNPTEAGSFYNARDNNSDSKLLEFSQNANTLHTKTQMANWLEVGRPENNNSPHELGCATDKIITQGQPSNTVMEKTVTINSNVITYNVNVALDPNKTLFVVATGAYLTSDFSDFWTYYTGTHQWQNVAPQTTDPKIAATGDGRYALGVIPPPGWSAAARTVWNASNITIFTRASSYTATFIVGTLDEVKAGIVALVDPTK